MAGIFRHHPTTSTPCRRSILSPFCTSPGQQDVTDNSYVLGYRSPSASLQYAGNISPGQGRSVREFEEQMASLRKENFNLKLRLYFLEEKIPGYSSQTADGHESLIKQNVDLKVEIEILRKELQDKQALLCEAAKAMELMEEQQKASDEKSQAIIEELKQRISDLEMENKQMEKCTKEKNMEDLLRRTDIATGVDTIQKIHELESCIKQYEDKTDELTAKMKEMESLIEEKNKKIEEFDENIKKLMFQNAELEEQLEIKNKEIGSSEYPKLREELDEYKKQLADKICVLEETETKLKEKVHGHENACKAIQKLLHRTKELEREIDKLKKVKSCQNVSNTKEDIQGSISVNTQGSLKDIDSVVDGAIWDFKWHIIIAEKDAEINKLNMEIKKKTASLQNLINKELWEKNREIERLMKLVNSKSNLSSSLPSSPVREIEQLRNSFTDSEYTLAIERNKCLQQKVDTLIRQLYSTSEQNPNSIIEQLKIEVQEAREEADKANKWRKEHIDICIALTDRLEELAGFLDSLLRQEDVLGVLGADRKHAIRKVVNKSLDLSRSLNNISFSITGYSLGEQSLTHLNNISGLLNTSGEENKENQMLNTCDGNRNQFQDMETLKAEVKALKKELDKRKIADSVRKERRSLPIMYENQSESEAWSEPDRNVSLARIGLGDSLNCPSSKKLKSENVMTSSESETDITYKIKSKAQEKINQLENMILERDNRILKIQCELVEADNRLKKENIRMIEINRELEEYKKVNEMLEIEIANYKNQILRQDAIVREKDNLKRELEEKTSIIEKMQDERSKLKVDIRVAEAKIETLKNDISELKQSYEQNIQDLKDQEQQKLNNLHDEMTTKLEQKLIEQEEKHNEYLAREWISRSMYEETKRELEQVQKKLIEAGGTIEYLHENESELNKNLIENEKTMRSLKKNLDDATLQASKTVLERTKILKEKMLLESRVQQLSENLEKHLQEKLELSARLVMYEKSLDPLHQKLTNNTKKECKNGKRSTNVSDASQSGYTSEDVPVSGNERNQRLENSSPDLGIETDAGRTSSVDASSTQTALLRAAEANEHTADKGTPEGQNTLNRSPSEAPHQVVHDCAKIEQENADLRRKLIRTKRAFEKTIEKLRESNQKKEQIERDIKQQILKTQNVLKNVRTNMESEQHKSE